MVTNENAPMCRVAYLLACLYARVGKPDASGVGRYIAERRPFLAQLHIRNPPVRLTTFPCYFSPFFKFFFLFFTLLSKLEGLRDCGVFKSNLLLACFFFCTFPLLGVVDMDI